MRKVRRPALSPGMLSLGMLVLLFGSGGCIDAVRDGVTAGLTEGIAAVIEAAFAAILAGPNVAG